MGQEGSDTMTFDQVMSLVDSAARNADNKKQGKAIASAANLLRLARKAGMRGRFLGSKQVNLVEALENAGFFATAALLLDVMKDEVIPDLNHQTGLDRHLGM